MRSKHIILLGHGISFVVIVDGSLALKSSVLTSHLLISVNFKNRHAVALIIKSHQKELLPRHDTWRKANLNQFHFQE